MPHRHGEPHRPWYKRAADGCGDCADVGECCDSPCLLTTLNLALLWRWVAGAFAPSAVDPHTAPPRGRFGRLASRFVRSYQVNVSIPRGRAVCPMQPTCSRYALQALSRHGLLRGGRLVVGRLRSCSRPGGYDPVPAAPAVASSR